MPAMSSGRSAPRSAHGDVDGARRLAEAATERRGATGAGAGPRRDLRGQGRRGADATAAARARGPARRRRARARPARAADGAHAPRAGGGSSRLLDVRTFAGPDDYFRLARAARGSREFLLANDAYQRIDERAAAPTSRPTGATCSSSAISRATRSRATARRSRLDPRWVPALHRRRPRACRRAAGGVAKGARGRGAVAPNHPDVWLFTAERDSTTKTSPARARRSTSSRPCGRAAIEEAALRAAVAYKEDGIAGGRCRRRRACARSTRARRSGYRAAGEQAAREYRFDEAAAFARKATAIDRGGRRSRISISVCI